MRTGEVYRPILTFLALTLSELPSIWVMATGWDVDIGVDANIMAEMTVDATARMGSIMKEECKTC